MEFAAQLNSYEEQFHALLGDMETRRSAHEILLAQLREGEFLEAGSVRSTLSGLSTASKRARFGAGRDLAEVERALAEERARLEAYQSSLEGQAQAAMDALRASDGESVPVPGAVVAPLLEELPTEQSIPLPSSQSLGWLDVGCHGDGLVGYGSSGGVQYGGGLSA